MKQTTETLKPWEKRNRLTGEIEIKSRREYRVNPYKPLAVLSNKEDKQNG